MNIPGFTGVAICGLLIGGVIQTAVEPTPFMTVHEVRYEGGVVVFEREVNAPATIADYTVLVVSDGQNDPVCEGYGWAEYTPTESRVKRISLDVFVGDVGCRDRLGVGEYTGRVYWVPRDGRVAVTREFTVTIDG